MCLMSDVTSVKNFQAEQARNHYQRQMISSVSHEFRTPLNAIMHNSKFLETQLKTLAKNVARSSEGDFSDCFERLGGINSSIKVSSKLMMLLVNDILDLGRMEGEAFKMQKQAVVMAEFFDELKDLYRIQCSGKKIGLECDLDFDLNWFVIDIDKSRLMQIANNFVSNALKFTPRDGTITISGAMTTEKEKEHLVLSVSDTGIGISEAD